MVNSLTKNRLREFLPTHWSDVDSLLDQFFGPDAVRGIRALRSSGCVWEDDATYHVELDVPGVSRDSVELTYDRGELRIGVERKEPAEKRSGLIDERHYGRLVRTVRLPESVDPETIEAELADGVLHVRVAKLPEAQPKRIEVK